MLLIKDMEMPKSCRKCPSKATFPNTGLKNGVCNDLHLPFRRHPYCPLIEIVTCEHCKYRHIDEDLHGSHCERYHNVRFPVYNDFWCADGKRKEE